MPSGEASTRSTVFDALQRGKKVFVPYIYKERSLSGNKVSSTMDMVSLMSEDDYNSLQADAWGIPTPERASLPGREHILGDVGIHPDNTETSVGNIKLDMIVVPGVAFDWDRRRLGHGKGFYDAFLSRYYARRQTEKVGELKMDRAKQPEKNDMPHLGESAKNISQYISRPC